MRDRPTGITILAVLAAIGGVLSVIVGLGSLMGGALIGGLGGPAAAGAGGFVMINGIVLLALGIASIALAYGFWTLKPWAWTLGVAVAAFSIAWAIISPLLLGGDLVAGILGNIISIVVWAVVLYYLMQPNIKAAFGRS